MKGFGVMPKVSASMRARRALETDLRRALALREANTKVISNLDDFRAFFKSTDDDKGEIHGGFAVSHFVDEPGVQELLKAMKVTIRCIPYSIEQTPGRCIFTGQPTSSVAIFAKAY